MSYADLQPSDLMTMVRDGDPAALEYLNALPTHKMLATVRTKPWRPILIKARALKDFNPDQPRGADGRWGEGGGGAAPIQGIGGTGAISHIDVGSPRTPQPGEQGNPVARYPTGTGEAPRPGMGDIAIDQKMMANLTQTDPVTGVRPSSAAYVRPDGTFTPERQALHDQIVSDALKGTAPTDDPHLVMMGGGPASGKSEMTRSGLVELPQNAVQNDPDAIKSQIPEAKDLQLDGDKSWAAVSHEESSYLSARITAAAYETSRSMVLDSTGDSTLEKLSAKIEDAHAAGFKVDANYITVHPDTGTARALARAEKTGREVPESVVRNTYASISSVFPQAAEKFDSVNLFDNNHDISENSGGQPRISQGIQLIASKEPGSHLTVSDQPKYNQFLSYGQ